MYGLQPFLTKHPGRPLPYALGSGGQIICWFLVGGARSAGGRILQNNAGTDASRHFHRAGHSQHARTMMAEYVVGVLRDYRPRDAEG